MQRLHRTNAFCAGAADNTVTLDQRQRCASSWEQVFLGNGPDDCCGRLGEVARSLRLCQRWLRQSVGRQSSLTEKQLSNQCANRDSIRRHEKVHDSKGLLRRRASLTETQCLVFVQLPICWRVPPRHSGACVARIHLTPLRRGPMDSGFDASHRPGMTGGWISVRQLSPIWFASGSVNPSGRYCHRPCAACRS